MARKRHTNIPAAYLILIKDNNILLLRRFNTGYEDGNYSLVAGHLEPGETFTECIIREAKEEAGILINKEDLETTHIMHRDSGLEIENERIDVFFIAKKWMGEIKNQEPNKCDNLSWFAINELPKNMVPYIEEVINHINNKIYYSEYGWK